MSKTIKYFILKDKLPEWGISPMVSTAVPIAASGTEIKSMKDVSDGMYVVLRSKLGKNQKLRGEVRRVIIEAKKSQPKGKHYSGAFYKAQTRAAQSGIYAGRKARKG